MSRIVETDVYYTVRTAKDHGGGSDLYAIVDDISSSLGGILAVTAGPRRFASRLIHEEAQKVSEHVKKMGSEGKIIRTTYRRIVK